MHVIRLRGPWRYTIASSAEGAAAPNPGGKFMLPTARAAVLGPEIYGRVNFLRAFNQPTNLAGQRVNLVVEPAAPLLSAWLNDQPLEPAAATEHSAPAMHYDLAELLPTGNTLRLEMELPAAAEDEESLVGEVWLEIAEA